MFRPNQYHPQVGQQLSLNDADHATTCLISHVWLLEKLMKILVD